MFDRDKAGHEGAVRATKFLSDIGLNVRDFDWNAPVASTAKDHVHTPSEIREITILQTLVETTQITLPQADYRRTEFATALSQVGLPEANDGNLVRRLMQCHKRQRMID